MPETDGAGAEWNHSGFLKELVEHWQRQDEELIQIRMSNMDNDVPLAIEFLAAGGLAPVALKRCREKSGLTRQELSERLGQASETWIRDRENISKWQAWRSSGENRFRKHVNELMDVFDVLLATDNGDEVARELFKLELQSIDAKAIGDDSDPALQARIAVDTVHVLLGFLTVDELAHVLEGLAYMTKGRLDQWAISDWAIENQAEPEFANQTVRNLRGMLSPLQVRELFNPESDYYDPWRPYEGGSGDKGEEG